MGDSKRIKLIIVAFLTFLPVAEALRVELLSSLSEVVATKNIALRVCFEEYDYALYKHFLQFNLDVPECKIESWKSTAAAFSEYVAPFRAHKLLYIKESFRIDVSLSFMPGYHTEKQMFKLEQAHLIVSGIVLGKDKKNRSFSQVISLTTSPMDLMKSYEVKTQAVDRVVDLYVSRVNSAITHRSMPIEKEEFWLDRFLPLYSQISNGFYYFLTWPLFFPWYLFLLFIALLVGIGHLLWGCPTSLYWQELERFFVGIFLAHHIYFLQFISSIDKVLYVSAFFCLAFSIYYFYPIKRASFVFNKIRLLFGMGLFIAVILIVMKIFLLYLVP